MGAAGPLAFTSSIPINGYPRTLSTPLYIMVNPWSNGLQRGDTPFEFTNRLNHQLRKLAIQPRWKKYFLRGINQSTHLTTLYARLMYSPHAPLPGDQVTAIHTWYHLRTRLWLAAKIRILFHLLSRINQSSK